MADSVKKTRVYLEDVHIGISPKTGNIYIGTIKKLERGAKELEWDKKVDRTSEFYANVLTFCPPGQMVTIEGAGRKYAVQTIDIAEHRKKRRVKIIGIDGKPLS